MSNFKKIIAKNFVLFLSLLICVLDICFLLMWMDEIWDGCYLWLPGVGAAGIFGSVGLMGIIISLAPKRRPPKILFYSLFFFFVIMIVSSFKDTLWLRGHDCYALQQESLNSHVGVPCGKTLAERSTEKWNTYYDERYKYSLDFPAGLNVDTIYEHTDTVELSEDYGGGFLTLTINGGVTFSPTDLPLSVIAVEVFENSKFQSLDKWLENENSKEINRIVEKKINIDGNEAIATYQVSMLDGKIFEEFKHTKTTVFIKDKKLFTIYTVMEDNDHEKVWNSFKFNKEQ